jgi:hypothetical protein
LTKQENIPGILGGIVKGLKGSQGDNSPKFTDEQQLEELLSTLPFTESSIDALDEEEEINIGSPSLSLSLSLSLFESLAETANRYY